MLNQKEVIELEELIESTELWMKALDQCLGNDAVEKSIDNIKNLVQEFIVESEAVRLKR